jgi:hypothetical protein
MSHRGANFDNHVTQVVLHAFADIHLHCLPVTGRFIMTHDLEVWNITKRCFSNILNSGTHVHWCVTAVCDHAPLRWLLRALQPPKDIQHRYCTLQRCSVLTVMMQGTHLVAALVPSTPIAVIYSHRDVTSGRKFDNHVTLVVLHALADIHLHCLPVTGRFIMTHDLEVWNITKRCFSNILNSGIHVHWCVTAVCDHALRWLLRALQPPKDIQQPSCTLQRCSVTSVMMQGAHLVAALVPSAPNPRRLRSYIRTGMSHQGANFDNHVTLVVLHAFADIHLRCLPVTGRFIMTHDLEMWNITMRCFSNILNSGIHVHWCVTAVCDHALRWLLRALQPPKDIQQRSCTLKRCSVSSVMMQGTHLVASLIPSAPIAVIYSHRDVTLGRKYR